MHAEVLPSPPAEERRVLPSRFVLPPLVSLYEAPSFTRTNPSRKPHESQQPPTRPTQGGRLAVCCVLRRGRGPSGRRSRCPPSGHTVSRCLTTSRPTRPNRAICSAT